MVTESLPHSIGCICSLGITHEVQELYPAMRFAMKVDHEAIYFIVILAYCSKTFEITNAHVLTQFQNHASAVRRQLLRKNITQTPSESHQDLFS